MIGRALSRPVEAWRAVVGLVRALTQPPADVARCDAAVESVGADSAIVRAIVAAADACGRAAIHSSTAVVWRRMVSALSPKTVVERVRAVGCVAAVAAATNLVLRLAGTGTEPLTWILPTAFGTIGLACVVGADAVARALVNYHR